jgi:hypothetical protein
MLDKKEKQKAELTTKLTALETSLNKPKANVLTQTVGIVPIDEEV